MIHPAPIEWSDALSTGVEEIDSQHRILVAILNEANAKLCDSHSGRMFDQITKDLLGYAIYHFDTEEGLMKQYGYVEPDAERHRQAHRAFSAKVVKVRRDMQDWHDDTCAELLTFLNDWLVEHIRNTDRQLAEFILRARRPTQ